MTQSGREAAILEELASAAECFRAAELLHGVVLDRDALSRLYFGVVDLARALLASRDLEPKSHRGVKSLVSQHLILTGLLEPEHSETLARLETWRDAADYQRFYRPREGLFAEELRRARAFEHRVTEILRPSS